MFVALVGGLSVAVGGVYRSADAGAPPSIPNAPDLKRKAVVTGLNNPWDLAFTPDGKMLVTQRSGAIGVKEHAQVRVLKDLRDVQLGGNGGLLGLAVDPAFSSNRRIYVCLSSSRGDTPTGYNADNRIVRFKVTKNYTGLKNRTDILTGIPYGAFFADGSNHNGCRVRFGPDGYLWITTGDAVFGPNPQNHASLSGKVLRIGTDGDPAPGNAGEVLADASFDPRVYTYGHRNVQGIAFRPGTMSAFSAEHGSGRDDEVNQLCAGCNYGRDPVFVDPPPPPVPPPFASPYYNDAAPMTDTTKYPDAVEAVWTSGDPTIAPSGATFIAGPQWKGYNGALVLAVLKDTHLHVLLIDSDGTVGGEDVRMQRGVRLRSVVEGPNGDLYVATDVADGGGEIWRVSPKA